MSRTLRIAAAQYPLTQLADLGTYEEKITHWVEEAVGQGAELLVFPEYGAMELCAIGGRGLDLQDSIDAVSDFAPDIGRVHGALAKKHGVTIVSGSGPQHRGGKTFNVAQIFGPKGAARHFEKYMPTPWERNAAAISGGRHLKVFDIGKAKIGLLICYDIEFPLLSRALAEAGAEIILAPSNTETEWGYWRVRTGAMARALENQVYTVHAPVVGPAPFCTFCSDNTGAAGIFAPSDKGFPPGGVLALGEMNKAQWVHCTVDLDLMGEVRVSGGVQTFAHWPEQPGAGPLPQAELINLG
ncbi:MAG: carbon-nitrogen hydrolase family protein [Alphaproteobacteria bacterium]|nr:carbon-nitrogen hydrolase family protein [Alphaproteobacteria bacterium]